MTDQNGESLCVDSTDQNALVRFTNSSHISAVGLPTDRSFHQALIAGVTEQMALPVNLKADNLPNSEITFEEITRDIDRTYLERTKASDTTAMFFVGMLGTAFIMMCLRGKFFNKKSNVRQNIAVTGGKDLLDENKKGKVELEIANQNIELSSTLHLTDI